MSRKESKPKQISSQENSRLSPVERLKNIAAAATHVALPRVLRRHERAADTPPATIDQKTLDLDAAAVLAEKVSRQEYVRGNKLITADYVKPDRTNIEFPNQETLRRLETGLENTSKAGGRLSDVIINRPPTEDYTARLAPSSGAERTWSNFLIEGTAFPVCAVSMGWAAESERYNISNDGTSKKIMGYISLFAQPLENETMYYRTADYMIFETDSGTVIERHVTSRENEYLETAYAPGATGIETPVDIAEGSEYGSRYHAEVASGLATVGEEEVSALNSLIESAQQVPMDSMVSPFFPQS